MLHAKYSNYINDVIVTISSIQN